MSKYLEVLLMIFKKILDKKINMGIAKKDKKEISEKSKKSIILTEET